METSALFVCRTADNCNNNYLNVLKCKEHLFKKCGFFFLNKKELPLVLFQINRSHNTDIFMVVGRKISIGPFSYIDDLSFNCWSVPAKQTITRRELSSIVFLIPKWPWNTLFIALILTKHPNLSVVIIFKAPKQVVTLIEVGTVIKNAWIRYFRYSISIYIVCNAINKFH